MTTAASTGGPTPSAAATPAVGDPLTRPPRASLTALRPLWRYLRPYGKQMVGASIALVLAAGSVLVIGQGLRQLIDHGFVAGNEGPLDRALIGLVAIVVVLAIATFSRYYLVSWIGERVVADLRRDLFGHVLTLDAGYFETVRTGDLLSRLTVDTTLLQTVVGSLVSVALRNLLTFLGGLVFLLVTSPKLTGLVLLVVPLVLVPILGFGRQVRRLSRASQDRVADAAAYAEEALNAVRAIQSFTHEAIDRRVFTERAEAAFDVARRRIRIRAWLTALVILLVFGAIAVILWIGGKDVMSGRLSAGDLSAFMFYAIVVAGAVGSLSESWGELQRAAGSAERLFDLLEVEPAIRAPATPVPLPAPVRGSIAFNGVRFHYPARPDRSALDGLSFAVAAGETVALVGPSGAGKTTVFQLLQRFYDLERGTIRIDGVDITAADPAAVRGAIGLVPQEPVIFGASAADNIRFGRPHAGDEEVRAAADAAGALAFIERLPEGFATFLGEKGVRLSGGQRQRIAIARAILRDAPILLLDEATSALDAETERAVQRALETLARDRTTLVIAHRLATVQRADRILVLEEGRLVAEGTHDSLVRDGGLYARLAELQFGVPGPL